MTDNSTARSLAERPRFQLGFYPTPLHELPHLRAALGGGPRLFIKRDDCTGLAFGGNKVRKLEYELAAAQASGAEVVITTGGLQSNHCRQTAAAAGPLGLRCVLVQNGVRPARPTGNALLNELLGCEIHYVAAREEREPKMQVVAAELRAQGRRVYEIPLGASTPLGACGYVEAMRELVEQVKEQALKPAHIFVSSSSGGTQAGLEVGRRLFGLTDTQIVGVSPDVSQAELQAIVAGIANSLLERWPSEIRLAPADIIALDQYVGAGYGIPTPEATEAIQLLARTEGILLDPVYTGKAFAGFLAWLRAGRFKENEQVLFWHTGGNVALFAAE